MSKDELDTIVLCVFFVCIAAIVIDLIWREK